MTDSTGPMARVARPPTPWMRDALIVTGIGLVLRLAVVLWARDRFPPAGDGTFYQVVAGRIARGLGYTWAWPDGAVTYAAHYPVGYPATLGVLYALFGPRLITALLLNAFLGALAVFAVHRIVALTAPRGAALTAGLLVALHPTLVAYTPALMTDGVAATPVALCAWVAVRSVPVDTGRTFARIICLGLLMGVASLVRPQLILIAPVFGALAGWWGSRERRGRRLLWRIVCTSVGVTALAVATCVPWTMRNCARMGQCVLISANGGWNLLIGTHESAHGAWVALDRLGIPPACRRVYGEAEKDSCFGRAALTRIQQQPLRWLLLMPAKLQRTLDEVGAPGWYLNESNPREFGDTARAVLGTAEVLWQRGLLLAVLAVLACRPGPNGRSRRVLGWIGAALALWVAGFVLALGLAGVVAICRGALALRAGPGRPRAVAFVMAAALVLLGVAATPLTLWLAWRVQQTGLGETDLLRILSGPWAHVAYILVVVQACLLGGALRVHRAAAVLAAVVTVTLVTHAVFFGASRYAMVCFPLMGAVAGCATRLLSTRRGPACGGPGPSDGLLTAEPPAGDTLVT